MRLSVPIYQLKRRAHCLARDQKIPLHQALDQIAREEGFSAWSLLAAKVAVSPNRQSLLSELANGDLLLIAARPGQGKTLLALQLLIDGAQAGRAATLFSLDLSHKAAVAMLGEIDPGFDPERITIDTSDAICADHVISGLASARPGDVAVIDYLQILDQDRSKPSLEYQLESLAQHARSKGVILAFISQIDRNFDPDRADLPGVQDIRLPNPVPAGLFTKACMLQGGQAQLISL